MLKSNYVHRLKNIFLVTFLGSSKIRIFCRYSLFLNYLQKNILYTIKKIYEHRKTKLFQI